MKYIAVVDWKEGRVAKYLDFPTEDEAAAHVEKVKEQYPQAFYCVSPGGSDWLVDLVNRSVSVDNAAIEANKKASATAAINAAREVNLASGFTYKGGLYHCDPIFQSQVVGFLAAYREGLLSDTAKVSIRTKGNASVLMSRVEVLGLAGALMRYVQGVYAESWRAKDALGK